MGYLSPPPSPAPVVVVKDVGGLVSDYEAQTEMYRRENREVRLHECRSACTMALSLPNVCVYPDAKVKFHQAYNAITKEVDYSVSARLFGYYPEAVRSRLDHLTREYRVLSGTELIALGVRNCNGDDRIMIAQKTQPARPAAPEANPLRDIAQSVQTAVAGALERGEATSGPPIRVAVADRTPVTTTVARLFADPPEPPAKPETLAALPPTPAPNAAEPPLPPHRPPSLAMTGADARPIPRLHQLIAGAQPILSNTQFAPRKIVARDSASN